MSRLLSALIQIAQRAGGGGGGGCGLGVGGREQCDRYDQSMRHKPSTAQASNTAFSVTELLLPGSLYLLRAYSQLP